VLKFVFFYIFLIVGGMVGWSALFKA